MYTDEQIKEYRDKIVASAKNLIRTKFVHRGRTRNGVDCIGFVIVTYRRAGLTVSDGGIYHPGWYWDERDHSLFQGIIGQCKLFNKCLPGDLVLFTPEMKINKVTHVGIMIDDVRFLHARSIRCVEWADLSHRFWQKSFFSFARYKEFIQ